MFDKAKEIIKEDAGMKIYDETKPLYIEMNASGVTLQLAPYKQEVIPAVPEMKYWIMAYSDPLHSPARAGPRQKKDIAI